MANYVLLFDRGAMPQADAERAALMQAWGAWFGGLGEALVNSGSRFTPNPKRIASDGTVSDDAVGLSGFSVIKAASLDEAIEKVKNCPVFQMGGQLTVYETLG